MRRPPAIRVEQKQAEQAAPELRSHLVKIRLPARSGRQLNRQVLPEEVVEVPQRLDREEVQRKPNWPAPVGVAAKEAAAGLSRFVVESAGATVEIENERVFLVVARERSQSVWRQKFALVEHTRQDALKAGLLDQRNEAGPAAGREIVEVMLRPQFMFQIPTRPFTKQGQ